MRRSFVLGLLLASPLAMGCRPCFLLNPYADVVDHVNDTHIYFDNWYMPRLDISRAGKPDWCGPINRHFGKQICYLGCYDRFDDCHLYPPSNPYTYPGGPYYETHSWGGTLVTPRDANPPAPSPFSAPPMPSTEVAPAPPAPTPQPPESASSAKPNSTDGTSKK